MRDSKARVGVVGVGYLGKFHAEKYAGSSKAQLVAVVDIDRERAEQVARDFGTSPLTDYHELFGKVDCVSVATSTRAHYEITRDFLQGGVDVLVEKPIAVSLEEAREMVELSRRRGLVLQVGHLERFNPAIRRLEGVIREPRFIECHRLAPFAQRGTDVDVILDLMIHDIDVIASLVRSPVDRVEAVGVPVLTESPDIANARITFANGCIANVTSSRVSIKRERKIRFFQRDAYISIDYDQKRAQVFYRPETAKGWQDIRGETFEMKDGDALADEIDSFLDAVRTRGEPLVTGEAGLRALEIAQMIRARL